MASLCTCFTNFQPALVSGQQDYEEIEEKASHNDTREIAYCVFWYLHHYVAVSEDMDTLPSST